MITYMIINNIPDPPRFRQTVDGMAVCATCGETLDGGNIRSCRRCKVSSHTRCMRRVYFNDTCCGNCEDGDD